MRELAFVEPGVLAWRDADEPKLSGGDDVLVRPIAVARCDLDAAILAGRVPAPGPYAFGHECVAEVIAVGDRVRGVAAGDRVIVPFQISCGACARCRRGLTASCTAVPPRSMYGFGVLGGTNWGGMIADVVRVPFADAMLVRCPEGASAAALASASDNMADGYRTVARPLAALPGAVVLIVGGGAASVGLYAVASAVALGASRVDYLDRDPRRRELAERLGARPVDARATDATYPITVDASADPAGLATAVTATEPGGVCTSVGIYYDNATPMPLLDAYRTGITFVTGRVDSRATLPEVIAAIVRRDLSPELVTTRVAAWDDAPAALLDLGPKVVLVR